jgi:hypothetical protein
MQNYYISTNLAPISKMLTDPESGEKTVLVRDENTYIITILNLDIFLHWKAQNCIISTNLASILKNLTGPESGEKPC